MLVVCSVNDGNLALNTNPMPDGEIEPRQVENFRKIGAWLEKYGESIYGTRGGPFVAPDWKKRQFNTDLEHFAVPGGAWWGGSTRKDNIIYLHILRWPTDTITLPAIQPRIVKHTVLTGGEATVKQTATDIEVTVAAAPRDGPDTIIKLELDAPAMDIPALKCSAPLRLAGVRQTGNLLQRFPETIGVRCGQGIRRRSHNTLGLRLRDTRVLAGS